MKQLKDSEVSIAALIDVFESAFMKIEDKEAESFKVQCENLRATVLLDTERKFISFRIIYGLSGSINLSDALVRANKVNEEYIFIKFAAIEYEGDIYLESKYYMTFEDSLNAFQAVTLVKKFEKYTVDALREYFNDYI